MQEPGIAVVTSALDRAAWAVGRSAAETRRLTETTRSASTVCADAGSPALDAALLGLIDAWTPALRAVAQDLQSLQVFLRGAAELYRETDAGAVRVADR